MLFHNLLGLMLPRFSTLQDFSRSASLKSACVTLIWRSRPTGARWCSDRGTIGSYQDARRLILQPIITLSLRSGLLVKAGAVLSFSHF